MGSVSNVAVHRATPFGVNLRHWRSLRGLTQLELATAAQTPARHVSFLETGRARPSHAMVTRLAEALGLSLRDRNTLLAAAGFGPDYSELPLDAAELGPFRDVVTKMLATHEPYPAYVIDRHWNIVDTNAAAGMFLPPDGERNAVRLT